jgi:hypothetical protein
MSFIEKEVVNNFLCKIASKVLYHFGFNRFTYKIFSLFYGLGYKYSFGSIRFEERDDNLYMMFMPWYFGNKKMVNKNIYDKIMLYGAEDFLEMINYFKKNKGRTPKLILSHSNKEIAFLIHRKLGFKFKKYNDEKEANFLSKSEIFELYISVDDIIKQKNKIKRYISILKHFDKRK